MLQLASVPRDTIDFDNCLTLKEFILEEDFKRSFLKILAIWLWFHQPPQNPYWRSISILVPNLYFCLYIKI